MPEELFTIKRNFRCKRGCKANHIRRKSCIWEKDGGISKKL